jgi:hypothetical protein
MRENQHIYGRSDNCTVWTRVSKLETGADRQRHHIRETGNCKALVDFMAKQLLQDLDNANQAKS